MARRNTFGAAGLAAFLALASAPAWAQGHQYVITAQGPDQATILDLASRTQREVTLSFNVTLLRKTPAHLPGVGLDVYWGDGVLQIECLDHHTRFMLTTGYTLDRSRRFDEPSPAFHPWSDNAEGTPARALEDFVCHGRGAANFARIDDLGAFTRGFVGGQAVAAAAPPAPAPAAPPPAAPGAPTDSLAVGLPGDHAPPNGMSHYYVVSMDADGALLLDMTSTERHGQVVSLTEYDLLNKPTKSDGVELAWIEGATQIDCARHRLRTGARGWLTLDRKTRVNDPQPSFQAWQRIGAGTPGEVGEALICNGKIDATLMPSDDLGEFQQELVQALAERAKAKGRPPAAR